MNRRQQFSLTALLLGVLVSAVIFAIVRYNLPSQRYRRNRDSESLRTLLSRSVAPGDSLVSVAALLGRGEPEDELAANLRKWQAGPRFKPRAFPEGIEDDDVFVSFESKPRGRIMLQFRDGKLVNFDPAHFKGANNMIDTMSN